MKYTENVLKTIIAICEQDDDSVTSVSGRLATRCRKALACDDVSIRLNRHDKAYLQFVYDEDMDVDTKEILKRILS